MSTMIFLIDPPIMTVDQMLNYRRFQELATLSMHKFLGRVEGAVYSVGTHAFKKNCAQLIYRQSSSGSQ